MHDSLGVRMKEQYESRSQTELPRRTYTIIRLDGKAFHTLTRGCDKPFDYKLMEVMDRTTRALCEEIQGVKFAYTQSDEISLLLTDFEAVGTEAWFGGNVQKICSISAAIATAFFNDDCRRFGHTKEFNTGKALFDSRCFTIPDPVEARNYFVWRQQDATRNAINMVGQSLYSSKELHGKNVNEVQEMIFQKGQNFNDYPDGAKRGRVLIKKTVDRPYQRPLPPYETVWIPRNEWITEAPPIFTQDVDYLKMHVPLYPDFEYKKLDISQE